MRMPSHTALCSFVFSVILTVALVPSSGGAEPVTLDAPPLIPEAAAPANVTSMLTPEVIKKIRQLIALTGTDNVLFAPVANALGFTAPGLPWLNRQITNGSILDNLAHVIGVSRGNDPDFMIYTQGPTEVHFFRVDPDGKVVAALIGDLKTGRITMRTPDQRELNNELAFWAGTIDQRVIKSK